MSSSAEPQPAAAELPVQAELLQDGEEIIQPPGVLTKEQVERFNAEMAKARTLHRVQAERPDTLRNKLRG